MVLIRFEETRDSAAVPLLTIVDANGAILYKAGNIETPELGFEFDWKAPADVKMF